jgi:hypothetical protein
MTVLTESEAAKWKERAAIAMQAKFLKNYRPSAIRQWLAGANVGESYLVPHDEAAQYKSTKFAYNWGRRYGLWVSVQRNPDTGELLLTKTGGPHHKRKTP